MAERHAPSLLNIDGAGLFAFCCGQSRAVSDLALGCCFVLLSPCSTSGCAGLSPCSNSGRAVLSPCSTCFALFCGLALTAVPVQVHVRSVCCMGRAALAVAACACSRSVLCVACSASAGCCAESLGWTTAPVMRAVSWPGVALCGCRRALLAVALVCHRALLAVVLVCRLALLALRCSVALL